MFTRFTLALLAIAAALNVPAARAADLVTDWSQPQRWVLQTEVHLPLVMWVTKEINKEARIVAFQLGVVLECDPGEPRGKKKWDVECRLSDVAITAAGMASEEGRLRPILEEADDNLTGALVQLTVHRDGRVTAVDLDLEQRNRRVHRMNENLRLMVRRAIAGVDLRLPREGSDHMIWPQYRSLLMEIPSDLGTSGSSEVVHKITGTDHDGFVKIESSGKGVVVPADTLNNFDTKLEGTALFHPGVGRLLSRTWVVVGTPTPSSPIAQGFEGLPYLQKGSLRALRPDETVDLGETREVTAPGNTPSTLQQWPTMGLDPRPAWPL